MGGHAPHGGHQEDIELTGRQRLAERGQVGFSQHQGARLGQRPGRLEGARDQIGADQRRHPHADGVRSRMGQAPGLGDDGVQRVERPVDQWEHASAVGRGLDATRRAVEEPDAELLLQAGHPIRQGGLGHAVRSGRTRRPTWGGRLHWASTETSAESPGHLEGALEAGRRAADAVLAVSPATASTVRR